MFDGNLENTRQDTEVSVKEAYYYGIMCIKENTLYRYHKYMALHVIKTFKTQL